MASRPPPSARTPLLRGPQPNAESTPLPRNLSARAAGQPFGARAETIRDEQRRLGPSRIDEVSERLDSQVAQQSSRTQRRRINSSSSSASASASASEQESVPSPPPQPSKRVRDANRNLNLQRPVQEATAGARQNPKDRHVSFPTSRGDAPRRKSNPRAAPNIAGRRPKKVPGRRRARPYARVLREIRRFRTMHGPEAYGLLIRRAPFSRLVREVTNAVRDTHHLSQPIRWHVEALMALQEASEALLAHFFEDTNVLAAHARRITVMNRDAHTLMRLRQDR